MLSGANRESALEDLLIGLRVNELVIDIYIEGADGTCGSIGGRSKDRELGCVSGRRRYV